MRDVEVSTHEQALELIGAEPLATRRASSIGHTATELPRERKPVASVRAHANWRPGIDTLRPFLDRVTRL